MKIAVRSLFRFLICLSLSASAQQASYVFHQLSLKDGLSEGTVRSIMEDTRGFMWFGTEDGLNKYDGYKFSVYKHNPEDSFSVCSNDFKCFLSDSKGRLWIGTRHGINIYNHISNNFHNHRSGTYKALTGIRGDLECITEDAQGNIWIAAGRDGLYKISTLDKPAERFHFENEGLVNVITALMVTKEGNMLVGTRDGLLLFNTLTERFTDLRSLYGRDYHIRTMLSQDDVLWMCTTQGLKKIDLTSHTIKEYRHVKGNPQTLNGNNALIILAVEKDKFLIGIDGAGIDLFNAASETFEHYTTEGGSQLSSNNITALYFDNKGTLWAGTFLNGINFSNITTTFFVLNKNKPSPTAIQKGIISNFLLDSRGNMWVSTDGGGLYMKKKGESTYTHFSEQDANAMIGSDAVINLLEDSEGNIWITTYSGGLTRFTYPNTFKIFRHNANDSSSVCSNKLKSLCEYNNEIWISSYAEGLNVFNKKTQTFRHYYQNTSDPQTLPSDWVYAFLKDSKNRLWLGTFNGFSRYIPETDVFKSYYLSDKSMKGDKNHVMEVFEDSKHQIWLGTDGAGLVLFNPEKETFTFYSTKDGLPSNSVKTIIEDNRGNLWLATNNGICQFNIQTRKAFAYTIHDGVPPSSFFAGAKFKNESGRIYLGTNEGYLIIDPDLSVNKTIFPDVVLTDLWISNVRQYPGLPGSAIQTDISETSVIVLPENEHSFSLEFAALNFNIPRNNYYSYKLEGFDSDWNYSGKNRKVTYTNLDPGTYLFLVRASSNEKEWSEQSSVFEIVVLPAWWQTWWFKAFLVLYVIGLTAGLFYFRTRQIRIRNKRLSEEVHERTKELKDANSILAAQNKTVVMQSQQILEQQNELLEQKQSLEKTNAELAEWNEFQNRLIGVLGHDIRGPLQHFSLLLKYETEETSEWVRDRLQKTADSLSLLATDLLGWISLQSTKGELDYTLFTWQDVISSVLKQSNASLETKKIHISTHAVCSDMLQGVMPVAISCLRNVLANAIRFSNEGGVIELECMHQQEGYVTLRITDYGEGFDAANVNTLIQGAAFKGVSDSSMKEGAGLGMAICYDMLKRTGGWVEAASLPGSGATFYIHLPKAMV